MSNLDFEMRKRWQGGSTVERWTFSALSDTASWKCKKLRRIGFGSTNMCARQQCEKVLVVVPVWGRAPWNCGHYLPLKLTNFHRQCRLWRHFSWALCCNIGDHFRWLKCLLEVHKSIDVAIIRSCLNQSLLPIPSTTKSHAGDCLVVWCDTASTFPLQWWETVDSRQQKKRHVIVTWCRVRLLQRETWTSTPLFGVRVITESDYAKISSGWEGNPTQSSLSTEGSKCCILLRKSSLTATQQLVCSEVLIAACV